MIKALSITLTKNLAPFSAYLWQSKVVHKITEERGQQIIWVMNENDVTLVKHYFKQWQAGLIVLPESTAKKIHSTEPSQHQKHLLWQQCRHTPVTLAIIFMSVLTTLLMSVLPNNAVLHLFIFINPTSAVHWLTEHGMAHTGTDKFNQLLQIWFNTLITGQLWRLVTPIFLHFSLLHIAFNSAMFFFFGQRIELHHGVKKFILLVIVISCLSNTVQYFSGSLSTVIFGGLSGVIYGLVGFCWVRAKGTHDYYGIPSGIYIFMVIWLLLGYTGIFDHLIGTIANGAHAGGLAAGMIAGFLSAKKGVGQK